MDGDSEQLAVTRLLAEVVDGEQDAADRLMPLVFDCRVMHSINRSLK